MKIKHTHTAARAATLSATYLMLFFVAVSCKNIEYAMPGNNRGRLNEKEAVELLVSKDSLPFWFFTAKLGVDFKSSDQSNSFNITVKMRTDSAFSGTLSVATLIGGTYLVNNDSVYFTNKQKKCYVEENFSSLSDMFGTEIGYDFFQSLVLGLPVALDPELKYKHKNTKEYYIILSDKKKKDPRHEKNDERENKDNPDKEDKDNNEDKSNNRDDDDRGGPEDRIIIQYYINTENWHLDRMTIQVPTDGVDIDINYINRQPYGDFYLPEQTTIKIVHPGDSISIQLDYGNVKLNEPKDIDINIPESYEQCRTKGE